MPDPTAIFDALDTEYQRREAEAGAFPADLAEIAKTTPYVAEKLARQRGWTPTKAVDPEAFAYETAERLLKDAPDTPDEDVLAIKAWAQRRKGINVVREETAASADQDMTGAAGSAFNATAVPLASEASRATFGIPEFVARKVVAPVVEAVTGAKPATKEQVQAAQAQGREAHPFLSDLSGGVGATAGAMTLMVPAAGAMTPLLAKVGMSPGVASTVANLLAGAAHGGAVEGSAEGALRSGLFMGGQSALGRVFRGATPGAGRYLASEAAAGSTASVLSQLATEGHADPARVLADGVVNALFGIGGARAAGRVKARDHVAAEVAKGREIPEIVADDVFKAMWEESRTYPDPTVEAASTRGEFDARLAEMQASKAEIPAFDPVAEAKATAAEFDAKVAPESPAPTKPVLEAPRPVVEAPAAPVETPAPAAMKAPRIDPADVAVVRDAVKELSGRVNRFESQGVKVNIENFLLVGAKDGFISELRNSEMLTPALEAAINRISKAKIAEIEARRGPAPVEAPKAEPVPVAPDAPSSRTLVGTDKRGKEVWEIRGRFYVKDPRGRYGAAHPQEVAEAKASQPPAATAPEAAAPVDPVSKYAATPRYQERSVYDPKPSRPAKPTPEAKAIAKAIGESPDSVQWLLNKEAAGTSMYPDEARVYHKVVQHRMDNPPASKPGKQGERGAVDPTGPMDVVRELGMMARRWFGSATGRIKSYDTPAAKETYNKAKVAIDEQKRIRGEMGDELEAIERVSGHLAGVTEGGRAVTALGTPRFVEGKNYATSDFFDLIEGRRAPANPTEQSIMDLGRRVIGKLGKITQDAGLKQQGPDGTYHDFVANTDAIAPRISAPDMIDVIDLGPNHRAWRPVIEVFASKSGAPIEAVEADFLSRHKASKGEGPEGSEKSTQAEFQRQYPEVPVAVKVGGQTLRLFETNPATYFRRLVESRAARLGVVKGFGQDTDQGTPVKDLRDRFVTETNKPDDFVGLMRMLHGQQRTKPMLDPSSAIGRAGRGIGRGWSVARELMLTGSPVTNIPEPFTGSTLDFLGPFGVARAVARVFRGKSDPLRQQARQEGVVTRDRRNLSLDAANVPESVTRIATETLSTPRSAVENSQELIAGLGTMEKVASLAAGKGTERDVQRLLVLGYDQPTARRLAAGQGTPEEYARIRREAPGSMIGANLTRAEKSWVENTRWAKPVTVIGTYAFNTMRVNARQVKAFFSTMGTLADPTVPPAQKFKRAIAATSHLTQFLANKTLQGAAQYMIAAALMQKGDIAASELTDDPMGFLAKSFGSAAIGGPYAAAGRALFSDGDVAAISPAASVAIQAMDAVSGKGKYRDMDTLDRMSEFAKRLIPGARYLKSAAVAIGLGSEQALDIENARSAYWNWRRDFDPPTQWGAKEREDERDYRVALRSAYRNVTAGEEPEVVAKAVLTAIGGADAIGKDRKKAATSIRRRMLLTAPAVKDRLDALKKRIGDRAFKDLEAHDALLDSLADAVQRGE